MKVDNALIDKLAHLARLTFSETEKQEIQQDLQQMLHLVDKLGELDVEGVEPLVYVNEQNNVLREDVNRPSFDEQSILQQAPNANDQFFRVPKVIDK
ncbi:MAG: Asp-tRNA(Asn)/Glu-tRNA(Gln) amidotransferase subunit GatC [Saprospiraceae bacterium]|nr:Asp-tRNA(Asn)/Glu-tRNA(Gln) amidotransferase subunit GatC [Saprospiraceae bacterium]